MDIFGCENPGIYVKMGVSVIERRNRFRKDIVGWVIYIAVLLAIIITFRCFLMIGRVPSESMEPTLMVHDWLIGDRHAYEEEKPQRGDIFSFLFCLFVHRFLPVCFSFGINHIIPDAKMYKFF